jgi:uncharacterized delta-60 repeat protein
LGIGKQVTLLNNAGSPTIFKSNGTFNLNTNVAQNGSYAVTIGAQPNGQTCSVNNGTGSNVTFGINNINVFCTATVVPVLTKIGSTGSYAQGIAIQSDGKMVVTGVSSSDVAVVRYNANGSLDTSFGTAGIVTTNIFRRVRSTDWATGVAIQSDGKILVVGSTIKDGDPAQGLTLIRYNTDGSLDSSFADSGIAITMHPMKDTMGTSLAIQSDGKIVVAGIVTCVGRSTPGYCTLLQRFTKDGAADLTFNGPGLNRAEKTTKGARGVVLSNDGKILVVGSIDNGNAEELSVARYMPDGLIDTSFGNNGVTSVAIGNDVGSYNYGKSIVLQADGKILVSGGAHTNSSNNHFSLTRLLSNGRIDVNFGRFGSVVTNVAIPPESDHSHSLAVQPDGKILIAGEATVSRTDTFPFPGFVSLANVNFALVRYNINGSLDTTFGTNGIVTTDVNQLDNRAYAMAIQPNGFIVLVGESFTYEPTNNNGGFTSFGIVRYRPDGTIDTNFGPGY